VGIGRIDTHTHVVPPAYSDWLGKQSDYRGPIIEWSKEGALESFGQRGIETGILSVSTPGVRVVADGDDAEARSLARTLNEFCAEMVRDDPNHFGLFATLVLPDVDGSIEEARYALDDLGADGVVLLTNTGGTYVGAPEWDPLMAFLNERAAVVFMHPTALPTKPLPGISPGIVDFLADTTRATVNLVAHDCLTRYPGLKIVLSHGGGYVPYAASRIACGLGIDGDETAVMETLKKFYFDTALTGSPYALPSLLAFAEADHLTFGTDWHYEIRPNISTEFTRRLDEFPMDPAQRAMLNRGNAEKLFPRLAR
jgi:predicted TIM-barrel fold metal-dependent hydrolase